MSTRASGPSHHLRDRGGLDDGPRLRRIKLRHVLLRPLFPLLRRDHRYRIIIYPLLAVAAAAIHDDDRDDEDERRKENDKRQDAIHEDDHGTRGHVINLLFNQNLEPRRQPWPGKTEAKQKERDCNKSPEGYAAD